MALRGIATAICRRRPRPRPRGRGGLCLLATVWLVAALWLLAVPSLEAQATIDALFSALPVSSQSLTLPSRISLEAVRLGELSDGSAVSAGSDRRRAGRDLQAFGTAPTSDVKTVVMRRLPDLWQLQIPDGTLPDDLEVSYELIAANGRPDRLNHDRRADSEIEVRLRPLPVILLQSQGDGTVVQGGLKLELDVSQARVAGTYLGSLTVTVTHL